MKKLIKKIGQNKFQFFFLVGMALLLVVSLIVATTGTTTPPIEVIKPPVVTPPVDIDELDEVVALPFDNKMEYVVVRKFFDKSLSTADQEKALIKYNNSYRVSVGTGFQAKDGENFSVNAALGGKVIEIKESPLYSNYVVLEHANGVKTYYYGLSEVKVTLGQVVVKKDKIGTSGTTEIDKEALNHVYFKITKDGKHLNPEKSIGKKIADLK